MNKRIFTFISLVFLLGITLLTQSCKKEDDGKCTIWTQSFAYSEFYSAFQITIQDGYYVRAALTNDEWAQIVSNLNGVPKYSWDEATIKKWFISNGFGEAEATKANPHPPDAADRSLAERELQIGIILIID